MVKSSKYPRSKIFSSTTWDWLFCRFRLPCDITRMRVFDGCYNRSCVDFGRSCTVHGCMKNESGVFASMGRMTTTPQSSIRGCMLLNVKAPSLLTISSKYHTFQRTGVTVSYMMPQGIKAASRYERSCLPDDCGIVFSNYESFFTPAQPNSCPHVDLQTTSLSSIALSTLPLPFDLPSPFEAPSSHSALPCSTSRGAPSPFLLLSEFVRSVLPPVFSL